MGPDGLYDAHQSDHNYGRSSQTKAIEKQVGFGPPRCEIVCKYGGSSACDCSKYVQKESESETALGASYDSKYNCHSTALSCSWTPQKCPSGTKDVGYEEDLCRMGMFKTVCCETSEERSVGWKFDTSQMQAIGAFGATQNAVLLIFAMVGVISVIYYAAKAAHNALFRTKLDEFQKIEETE